MLRGDLLTDATLFAISSFKLIPVVAGFLYLVCGLASGPFAFKIFRRDYVPANARNVPWGLDVALIVFLIFSFVSPVVVVATASAIKGELPKTTSSPVVESEEEQTQEVSNVSENATDQEEPELAKDERDMSTLHPVARMLLRAKDSPRFPLVLALFLFGVIVVAPVTEELVFRVVAQGACERFASEKFGATTGLVPALAAIVPPALIFALLHFAPAEDPNAPASAQKLVESSIANVSGNLLSLCLILAILRFVCRGDKAKSPDEDVPPTRDGSPLARFALEFYRGAVLFLFAAPIIFLLNRFCKRSSQ